VFTSLVAPLLVLSLGGPVDPGTPGGPNLVVQAQPISRWITDIRSLRRVLEPGDPQNADKQFEQSLKQILGEKGFEGIDLDRPISGYGTLAATPTESQFVMVIPITGQDEFLALLDRLPEKLKADPEDGKKGLFRIAGRGALPISMYLRIVDQNAYVSFNDEDGSLLDPAKLLPSAKLVDPADQSSLTIRAFPDRLPAKLIRQTFDQFTQRKKDFLQGNARGGRAMFMVGFVRMAILSPLTLISSSHLDAMFTEGRDVALRISLTPTSEVAVEIAVTPKPNTKLAASIASYSPGTNRFSGLIPRNPALGVQIKLPFSVPDTRDTALDVLKLIEENNTGANGDVQPVLDELFKGLARTIKAGDFEAAGGMSEPGERALCHIIGAASFDDTSGLEKSLRKLAASLPASVRGKELITFDVAKVKGVNLHTIKLGSVLDDNLRSQLGEDALLCIAMAPQAIHFAMGPQPIPLVQASLEPNANDAKMLSVDTNIATLQRVIELASVPAGKKFKAMVGGENRMTTIVGLTAKGGAEFRFRMSFDPRFLPHATGAAAPPR